MAVNAGRKVRAAVNLGCGVLAGLALIFPFLWSTVFVCLVPLFVATVATNGTRWQACALGCVWGAGLMGASLSFIFAMLPFDWLGVGNPLSGYVAAFGAWAALTILLSVPMGLFAVLLWHLREARGVVLACICPIAWVLLEFARASLISILTLGPGTSIGSYFTFGFLGYALAGAHGLLQLAPLGGPLLLGGLIVLVNTLVYLAIRKWATARTVSAALCLGVLGALLLVNGALPDRVTVKVGASAGQVGDATVALVHTDQQASFTITAAQDEASRAELASSIVGALAAEPHARVVVLPEDSRFTRAISSPSSSVEHAALAALGSRGALLVSSSRSSDGAVARGVLYAYDFDPGLPVQASAKSYLVPFGEYVPYVADFMGQVLGFKAQVQALEDARASYRPASWNPADRIIEWRGKSYGLLSCSELFYPYYVRDLAAAGADAIVVLSSQSWIRNGSPVLFNQMLGMAVVDAAWVGKPWLQATNKAPNIVVDVVQ